MPHLNALSSKKPSLITPDIFLLDSHVPLHPGALTHCQVQAIVGCGPCTFVVFSFGSSLTTQGPAGTQYEHRLGKYVLSEQRIVG